MDELSSEDDRSSPVVKGDVSSEVFFSVLGVLVNRWLVHRWWLEAGVLSWLEAGVLSWLEAAAPRFGSRVSLGGLSILVCGIWARILLREEFCLWRPSNGGNSSFSGFVAPLVPPAPIKFPGGGGFLSSASPAKSPGGGGFLSSASPDRALKGKGVFYLAPSAFVCSLDLF
ncbi:hypothetical protein DY000_02025630 [Brassica cretica]|uniref:Reticulon domain-containing protein n=1 Tax=Brassica cretica TaxID=69181 RepID=A0ABQ7EE45_BRACR|nr:hypothetical protein DY000_02025630 [Brassica cretica]